MPRVRNRRLRKKLHLGEFRQFGFELLIRFRGGLGEPELASFWDSFITDAIEKNQLVFGGGNEGFVTGSGRATATDAHRTLVRSWLVARPEIIEVDVGELVDAWR